VTVEGTIHHNSGKSVAMVMEILRRASEMPPSSDGVRRSRCVIVRNTLQQLKSTCLVTFMEWLRPIARWKVSDATIYLEFTPADGIPVYCEVLLLPLDTPENQQRLLSLELTFAWVSEFREIPLEIVQAVFSRCGRYPSRANLEDYWYGVAGETNSFSEDSDYYQFLEVDPPSNVDYFIQPGGMDSDAENRENLPKRYYEDLIEANDEAWVSQYVHNQITESLSGQAVFAKSFKPDFHITDNRLYPRPGAPIIIGMDTGRNPAAVFGQMDVRGRLLVFGSVYAENVGMEKFLATVVKPFIAERFQGSGEFVVSIDPAARQRSQVGEESVKDAVQRLGFSVHIAPTNDISPRLRAVERFLNTQVDGKAGLLFERMTNETLIRALKTDYRYKRMKSGDLEEKPDKGHPESDLCFVAGTPVLTPDGMVPIETLCVGDIVAVPDGVDEVVAVGSHFVADLVRLEFSDGTTLTCTPEHPFAVKETPGFVPADELQYAHTLATTDDGVWHSLKANNTPVSEQRNGFVQHAAQTLTSLSGRLTKVRANIAQGLVPTKALEWLTGWSTTVCGSLVPEKRLITGTNGQTALPYHYTGMFGSSITGQSPTATKFTTLTTTQPTTQSVTLGSLSGRNTHATTSKNVSKTAPSTKKPHSQKPKRPQKIGTAARKVERGILSTPDGRNDLIYEVSTDARCAELPTPERSESPITCGTTAPLRVIKRSYVGSGRVYNLTTKRSHLYYAGGILVHNCDSLQYLCMNVGLTSGQQVTDRRREIKSVSAAGWT